MMIYSCLCGSVLNAIWERFHLLTCFALMCFKLLMDVSSVFLTIPVLLFWGLGREKEREREREREKKERKKRKREIINIHCVVT